MAIPSVIQQPISCGEKQRRARPPATNRQTEKEMKREEEEERESIKEMKSEALSSSKKTKLLREDSTVSLSPLPPLPPLTCEIFRLLSGDHHPVCELHRPSGGYLSVKIFLTVWALWWFLVTLRCRRSKVNLSSYPKQRRLILIKNETNEELSRRSQQAFLLL